MDAPSSHDSATGDRPVVHLIPLGGLGQVGMNCFALEQEGAILVVDCGATFPEDDVGEELVVPDFSWLKSRELDVVGVFITHGHEDHIGALPHLLQVLRRPLPVYAPAHAFALIEARLRDHGLDSGNLRVVEPGQLYELGPFLVEPIRVAHSIVQATALCIFTAVGNIVHTADFDLDEEQPAGWLTDVERFQQLGEQGVTLLLSDSTNIDSPTRHAHEGQVALELMRLVELALGRVIVGLFSSNAHRLAGLFSAAQQTRRKVCLLGRSLRRHVEIATRLGHLSYPSDLLIAPEQLSALEPGRVLVIAGGSQGEVASALKKLSKRDHPQLELDEGDTVILSARVIPGNEKRVNVMVNDFLRQNVQLITPLSHPLVHVSGHASRSELKSMMEWVRPRAFIPLHGTLGHMLRHQTLSQECGIEQSLVVENGARVEVLERGALRVVGSVPAGQNRLVDGGAILDGATRRQRYTLARQGVIFIAVQLDVDGRCSAPPKVSARGVVGVDRDEDALRAIQTCVARTVEATRGQRMRSLETNIVQAVRSAVLAMSSLRPSVMVHVFDSHSNGSPQRDLG